LATGVMVIAVGKATRLIQFLSEVKVYRAEIHLGVTTNTLDAEGQVTSVNEKPVSQEQFLAVIPQYTGKISQVPPMASAVHHNGVRLYQLARQGLEVERKAREVEIFSIKLLNFNYPKAEIEVNCQSGTYIRTLADDIGKELGCGAHLSGLRRTSANNCFNIEESLKVENLTAENLLPLDYPLMHLQEVILNEADSLKYMQGQFLNITGENPGPVRVYNDKSLIGIGLFEDSRLVPKVNLSLK
jgi:tRNA pseudouridine55 synthase